jgi:TonB family protein
VRHAYFWDKDFQKIRIIALSVSVAIHCLVFLGLLIYEYRVVDGKTDLKELLFGGSGGGGGEGAEDDMLQFGPQGDEANSQGKEAEETREFTLIQIHVYNDAEIANPVVKKEEVKRSSTKRKKQKQIIAENLPTRWVRRGTGPGSGGGAGGGSGGGIGAGQGYSIDWGGKGSRRLLSGRLPRYPDGTDKEMPVTLEFTVLADGSISKITPKVKSDELLERAAMKALQTWRFESLPMELGQKTQTGDVTFNFIFPKEK